MSRATTAVVLSPVHDRDHGVVRTRVRTYSIDRLRSPRNLDGRFLWRSFGDLEVTPLRVYLVVDDPDAGELDLSFVIGEAQRISCDPDVWELSGFLFRAGISIKVTTAFMHTGLFQVRTSTPIADAGVPAGTIDA